MSRFISGVDTKLDCDGRLKAGEGVSDFDVQRAITDGAE